MIKMNPKTRRTLFQILLPMAKKISVVGDFNDWSPAANPMKKDKKGFWRAEIDLSEGEHQFYYLINGNERRNDAECASVPNNLGSGNSILQVRYA